VSTAPRARRFELVRRIKDVARDDNLSLLAAGVAFFMMLAIVPALVAVVSIYGLVAEPSEVEGQVGDLTEALPTEARDLIVTQLRDVVRTSSTGLGFAAVGGIAVALWSASSGMKQMIQAIDAVYHGNRRGFLKLRALSLLLALAGIVFFVVALFLITVLPSVLADTGLADVARYAVNVLRFAFVFGGMLFGLDVLYAIGASGDDRAWRWLTPGAIFAALAWVVTSALFSIYTANFGEYNETYGTLGAVVILLIWLYLTALMVLIGAEINAELERRRAPPTTPTSESPSRDRAPTARAGR
jgi:membrane protein